jgi:hypothetical protein
MRRVVEESDSPMSDWVTSSFCADTACVQVAASVDEVHVRDGKHPHQPHLTFSHSDWEGFLAAIVKGAITLE